MPKMKLLLNTSEDEPHQLPRALCAPTSSHGAGALPLNKETVFEWFGLHLDPVRRLEFMCGLLHMCQPLELRFLGSYLEDLARKDYHVLRDFECRANSPSELGNLTDVNDPVVRSKILVCLSLLGSDSRDCAGILFRTLSSVDPALLYQTSSCPAPARVSCPAGREAPVDGSSEQSQAALAALEQLALLFTMASLHSAFHFHQRQMLRAQLDKTQLTVEEALRRRSAQALEVQTRAEECTPVSAVAPQNDVHIERIVLRGISRTKGDREYNFKVTWSDSSSSRVTKTHSELENFLLKLPKHQCNESFERVLLGLLQQEENKSSEEQLRNRLLSAPPVFTRDRNVCCFFSSDCGLSGDSRQPCSEPASDGSSQDEEAFVQGCKKKHRNKSPSLTSPIESHATERGTCESRSHAQPTLRGKGKTKGTPNGSLAANFQWKEAASGPDTLGESSSERSSCASSPQHRATDSLDSEEEQQQQHCAAWKQGPAYLGSQLDNTAEALGADPLLGLRTQMEAIRAHNTDVSALPFMPYGLPPGAPLSKPGPGAVRRHLPPAMAGPGLLMEPEKGDNITTFGLSPVSLPPPEISAMQPLVQRFKSLSHGGMGDVPTPPTVPPAPLPTPIRAISIMTTSMPSLPASLHPPLPCLDSTPMGSVPLVETPHTKLPALNLPYPLPPTPTPLMTSVESAVAALPPVQGLLQGAVPTVVPTHTPGPGPSPSPSPALTPSMAHSDCTSSSPSSEACVEGPVQRPQPTLSCGVCGCQCSSRPLSASPMFFHQVGAGARPLLGLPHLFPLTNYLPQAHAPQPNGTTLPPIYAHYGPLHSHTDLLGIQQQISASFCQRLYPQPYPGPVGLLPAAALGGGLNKKNGIVSCSNCGFSGHYTHDCNQPSIDSTQQGGFRLKYAASHISEAPDKAEGAV